MPDTTTVVAGRHSKHHLLDRLADKLAEQANHYMRDGIVHCDGHVCELGKHARAES